jgi:hypothetical protein
MVPSRLHNHLRKTCALVAVTLILPALAYADRDRDRDNNRDNHEQRGGDCDRHDPRVSAVPEANAGWVLIPFVGAVLLFSWRQFCRAKA